MNRCPICRAPTAARTANGSFPFCSERCKLVDLGRWLDEAYRIPSSDDAQQGEGTTERAPRAPKDEE